jgi:flagellar basal-body rod protein FlgF
MENPSYIVLSQQMGLRRQMDVIANNLANANTHGFKAERLTFTELVTSKAANPGMSGPGAHVSFPTPAGTIADPRDGHLESTGNQLDIGLVGPGYFAIETPGGPRYTRDGHFELDGQGRIVTRDGFALLDRGGSPLVVPPGTDKIEISITGRMTSDKGQIGEIQVVKFESDQALRKIGANLYETDAPPQPIDAETRVKQGMVEASNVQAIFEITNMIDLQRRYQASQRMIEAEHERARSAIQKLTRVA